MHILFRSFLFHVRFIFLAPFLSVYELFKSKIFRTQKEERDKGKDLALFESQDGSIKCVGCKLCEVVCPGQAIIIDTLEGKQGETYPYRFEADMTKCIMCGLCEQACPEDAIGLIPRSTLSVDTKEKLYYTKEVLLENGRLWKERQSS